jgi:hypothetical protein
VLAAAVGAGAAATRLRQLRAQSAPAAGGRDDIPRD